MADVISTLTYDSDKVRSTFIRDDTVTNDIYNELNKTAIDLVSNNNKIDDNAILFREEYNSSSKNLNNAIHQGVYSFTSSALNAPPNTNGGNLFVTNTSKTEQGAGIIITQIAYCHNGSVYSRTKNTTENFTAWRQLAYTESPVFTGTPTAPTPQENDNSTKIATTAFMQSVLKNKFTANKATNGWWKDGNTGMIFQWGTWSINSTAGAASTSVTFPISFPNKCLIVIPSVFNAASEQIGYNYVTNTGCKIVKGVNDTFSARNGIYLVIGY